MPRGTDIPIRLAYWAGYLSARWAVMTSFTASTYFRQAVGHAVPTTERVVHTTDRIRGQANFVSNKCCPSRQTREAQKLRGSEKNKPCVERLVAEVKHSIGRAYMFVE